MAGAVSRGYFETLSELCTQLHVALLWLPPHASVIGLLEDLRAAVDLSLRSNPPAPPDLDDQQHQQRVRKFGNRYSSDITGDGQAYSPPPSPPPPRPGLRFSRRARGCSGHFARLAVCGSLRSCLHHQLCLSLLPMVRPCRTDNTTHSHPQVPIVPTLPGHVTLRRPRPLTTPRESLSRRESPPWSKPSRRPAIGSVSAPVIPA